METVLKFLKDHVKATVAVTVLGFTVAFGWANGCTVSPLPQAPAPSADAGQP